MTVSDIKKICQIPEKDLLEFLLNQVNLTHKEKIVVDLCYKEGFTEEETAEELNKTVITIQNWKRSANSKIIKMWQSNRIIEMILKADN